MLILDLSFIDDAISTNISVEVSSPNKGTTISAFTLLMSSPGLDVVPKSVISFSDFFPLNKKDKKP